MKTDYLLGYTAMQVVNDLNSHVTDVVAVCK